MLSVVALRVGDYSHGVVYEASVAVMFRSSHLAWRVRCVCSATCFDGVDPVRMHWSM